MVTRGFLGRRSGSDGTAERLPPGQFLESGFPVLSAG
ncbi:MAG TPA: sulfite oxidase-like oxidoreductase, partial [Rhizobiaceae bacterium]